jgi:hypothetical protein
VHTPAAHTSLVQALPSSGQRFVLLVCWQPRLGLQVSLVQGLLSLHSAFVVHVAQFGMGVWVQPLEGLQASVVQALPSLQPSGVPAVQVAAWQVSVPLHGLPSLQAVPLVRAGWVHAPPPHTSLVQALPSSAQGAVLLVKTQPLVGLQLSAVQPLLSLQVSGVPALQLPAWQVSAPLQALPSLQAVPLGAGLV